MARYAMLVLLGPPGSGKSYLGQRLAGAGIARFFEMEPELIRRFGAGDEFAARKHEALAFVEQTYRAALGAGGAPLAIETTGLSERAMIERLMGAYPGAIIGLRADRETCANRIAARAPGRNLNNAPDDARQFHDFWTKNVAPAYRSDLVVSTEDCAAALAAVTALLA